MRKVIIALMAMTLSIAYAEPLRMITDAERQQVYAIGKANGIPLSIVNQLMIEESQGYVNAVSHKTAEGFYSRGLFQIYTKPGNVEWLLFKFWSVKDGVFNIDDPIDNSTLALRYLSHLHKRFENWTHALWYYNHGSITGVSDDTKAYARRIIHAK
jgi:hypothetical protein